jgi:uncharacterized protein YkwD
LTRFNQRKDVRKANIMIQSSRIGALAMLIVAAPGVGAVVGLPSAFADNKRLNDGVVANVYTMQHQAGCTNDVKINPQLQLAAQWHALDVLNNRALDSDIGSDGSTPQVRANAAGFRGRVAETVAINPAVAISGIELIHQWYYNPAYFAIMSDCANTAVGVWSENSPDRTVVVAVYGQPDKARLPSNGPSENIPIDPSPDYDASDELEFGVDWWAWILRGVYPPPGYPPTDAGR